jgi:hypothetical protein
MFNGRAVIKPILRHTVVRMGLENLRLRIHRMRGIEKLNHLRETALPDVFSAIYRSDAWVESAEQESLSGRGSSREATRLIVEELSRLLSDLNCRRLIDIGCGDFNWMQFVTGSWEYIGLDVVQHIIEQNKALYETSTRRFCVLDATAEAIPDGDVVICREVLFHLSFADIRKLINNIRKSDAVYLVATTEGAAQFNSNIKSGDYRPLNLLRPPFSFPTPIKVIPDDRVTSNSFLGVWRIQDLPVLRYSWLMG